MEKVEEVWQIPKKWKIMGIELLKLDRILASWLDFCIFTFFGQFSNPFSLANIEFWEKSFCTSVSALKAFIFQNFAIINYPRLSKLRLHFTGKASIQSLQRLNVVVKSQGIGHLFI